MKKMKKTVFWVFLAGIWQLTLTGAFAASTPAINSASIQSGVINITGTNFGQKIPAAPILWDNFNNGANGEALSASGRWTPYRNPGSYYTSTGCYGGTGLCGFNEIFGTNSSATDFNTNYFSFSPTDQIYYSYEYKFQLTGSPSGLLKEGRSNSSPNHYNGAGNVAMSGYQLGTTGGNIGFFQKDSTSSYTGSTTDKVSLNGAKPVSGQWQRQEIYKKNSTPGAADGVVQMFMGGNEIWDNEAIETRASGYTFKQDNVILPLMGANMTGNTDVKLWVDDVYVDNTRARVEIGNNSNFYNCNHREIQIPTSWNSSSIKVNINMGTFNSGDHAYLFVVSADGTPSVGYPITLQSGFTGSSTQTTSSSPPAISITSPTSSGNYSTTSSVVNISGTASDSTGIQSIDWTDNHGDKGTAANSSGDWSSWAINDLNLQSGSNVVTVTATDTSGLTSSANITIDDTQSSSTTTVSSTSGTATPAPSGVSAWSATAQTGDTAWKDSSVTRCVRLLVQGAQLTHGGDTVQLGFQGRTNGDYTIQEVSIAQRDPNGNEGDVVNSTWTKVTFDGGSSSTWGSDVTTIPAGQVKYSDPIPFQIRSGKDYYVTFKIDTPSDYLNPPSTYRELYFDSADHSADIDWSGTGYSTTQDYHALASIYVSGQVESAPSPPSGLHIVN